jgi:DNA-binding LacI/PurR family transcriptional regulator
MKNDSKLTIKYIADMAGVSIATVSRVLNHKTTVKEETRRRIFQVMENLNFNPTSVIRTDQTSNIILACVSDFTNPFYSAVIEGIQQSAYRNHYRVLIFQSEDIYFTFKDYKEILKNQSFAGIILITSVVDTKLLELLAISCPVVMCSEYCDENGISFVSIDNVSAARRATEYLISCGCKRIALMNSSLRWNYARYREEGYLQALKGAGLEKIDNYITHISSIDYNLALSFASNLLALSPPPDAFFTVSDVYAISVIHAAKKMGFRVPEDVSIIGFDNIAQSSMTDPAITTVEQPSVKIGYQSCELLIDKINNPLTIKKRIILNTELIVRESTAHLANRANLS